MNRRSSLGRWIASAAIALVGIVSTFVPHVALAAPPPAMEWHADVGAQSQNMAIQINYFFPRDITVNIGDSISWTFQANEIHSVTFPPDGAGGDTPFDSKIRAKGAPDFKLTFLSSGDFKYNCVIHTTMHGSVHVNAAGTKYPKSQKEYDKASKEQIKDLMDEGRDLIDQGKDASGQGDQGKDATDKGDHGIKVTVGIGAMHDDGSVMIMRFLPSPRKIRVGDTVTFTNLDPEAPHTFTTMNLEYPTPFGAVVPEGLDTVLTVLPGHATMSNPDTDKVNSGVLANVAFPFAPPPFERGPVFKVTFTAPGTYNYKCEFHDDLGMNGKIVVLPKEKD